MADTWDSSLYDDRHSFVWKKGAELLELLDAKPGERVLDLGCGTGHLTAKIAEIGAEVIGLDSSLSMVAQARQNFPKLKFQVGDARNFSFADPFDAVFSNAALHWVLEAEAAVNSMARSLKPGGRMVLEMGGQGNTARVMRVLEPVLRDAGFAARHRWYFPSVAEYATLLEKHGMTVTYVRNFQRWTQLEHPERGLREWLEMFAGAYFEDVPPAEREPLLVKIEDRLRPELYRERSWWIDYRRLRLTAERT